MYQCLAQTPVQNHVAVVRVAALGATLARAGLASAAIFAFLTSWNEYALASQLSRTVASKTMPVGLMDFTAQFTVDWTGMSAMAVLIIIPALILTFIVQKHLIAGLTFGGVKG